MGSLLFFLFAAAYLRLLLPCSYGLPRFRFDESLTMQLGPVGQPSHLGVPLSRETRPSLAPLALLSMVAKNPALASLRNLRFRDPVDIQAGSLHAHPTVWEELLHGVKYKHADLMAIIYEGVKIQHFFTHLKGDFRGKRFHFDRPPPTVLENCRSCDGFEDFISTTVLKWVSASVLSVWGEVGRVAPPHLVLPLTVEPSKPRLCRDECCLNLWIKDLPFKLHHLSDLPRYVLHVHYQTSFDEKSGYQPVSLYSSSRTSLDCNGRVFTSYFAHYLLAGKRVLFFITV